MASTIAAARQALYYLLVAEPLLAGVQISYGAPANHEEPEVVALLGVRNITEEPEQLGMIRKEETYLLDVGVKAHSRTADAATTDARGFAIAEAVRGVAGTTRTNITLSGTVRTAMVVNEETEGVQPAEGGGWVIFLLLQFECSARIT